MKLRDKLLESLKTLPNTRQFHLHCLVSAPRRCSDIFPYATTRRRIFIQDILVTVSEQQFDGPHVFVTAIEAAVYRIPATSSAILYISKVDSTGQGLRPSPTSALVRALLDYYIHPETRPFASTTIWIHLFARAQSQYIFPNSSEHSGKQPLTDVQLCLWWKRLLFKTVTSVITTAGTDHKLKQLKLFYVLPGLEELEALQALGELSTAASNQDDTLDSPRWTYGHPYSQSEIPLPFGPPPLGSESKFNLGHYIPSFDDDPKSRFLDEISLTEKVDGVRSPKRKKRKITGSHSALSTSTEDVDVHQEEREEDVEKVKNRTAKVDRISGELGVVSADDFWERISCPSSSPSSTTELSTDSDAILAPQPGQVSHRMNKRVVSSIMSNDFADVESALRSTKMLEKVIRDLCNGFESVQSWPTVKPSLSTGGDTSKPRPIQPHSQPLPLFVFNDALEEARKTPEPETTASNDPPRTPRGEKRPLLEDITPNPFPEPEASLETYNSYIYGTLEVNNPAQGKTAEPTKGSAQGVVNPAPTAVHVLTVRKKTKKQ